MKWFGSLKEQKTAKLAANDADHYTDCVEIVKKLKADGNFDEAIPILIKAIDQTENESRKMGKGWGVAPWYYEQLAIIYRKMKNFQAEIDILERYKKQEKAPGIGPSKLAARLIKARELLEKVSS